MALLNYPGHSSRFVKVGMGRVYMCELVFPFQDFYACLFFLSLLNMFGVRSKGGGKMTRMLFVKSSISLV